MPLIRVMFGMEPLRHCYVVTTFDDHEAYTLLAAVMPLGLPRSSTVSSSVYSTECLKHNSLQLFDTAAHTLFIMSTAVVLLDH